ncbi:6-hydroxynicotinate 3-monooxygenase [Bienertia sinuspersici]
MKSEMKQPKAVVVGGSIAGVSCAHALLSAGWQVLVVEKSSGPTAGSPTGAGLGLDPWACDIIASWICDSALLYKATLPLTIDQNQVTDIDKKTNYTLTRDEEFNFRAAHWADLHGLLHSSLPSDIFLWGHQFLSFSISDDKNSVTVKAKVHQTGEIIDIVGDLLVSADGCLSSIRQTFLPNHKLRYAGYCAWRGVYDFSGNEDSEIIKGIRTVYQDLGKCLYFDLGTQTHCVLYELLNKRMNWIWYINQPEPEMNGNSVTLKVSKETIKNMQEDAERIWVPELVALMKATDEPFVNVIYDSEPLDRIFWNNVVLVGDAAHPSTPHCLRSTNMSLLDAAVLGKCLEKWGIENLQSALAEYQSTRLPVVANQVLHSRRVGRIKQGLSQADSQPFDLKCATSEDCFEIQQKNVPFFSSVPDILLNNNKIA